MIITTIIVSSLLISSLYVNYNLFRKLEVLEDEIESNLNIFKGIYTTMKEIDSTGAFQSDDEVGSVFTDLKNIVERNEKLLNSEFGKEEGE
jgi:ethanolamine utilization microcompartment shell protein EutL